MDKDETFERKAVSFASIPELLQVFMQLVSGAADIPATRLLGMSPAGNVATGGKRPEKLYDHVQRRNKRLTMQPAMYRGDEALIGSALGARPAEIYFEWAPLWQMTAKERAEIGDLIAKTTEAVGRTGLVSSEALSAAMVNSLVENGIYPGLDQEVEAAPIDFDELDEHERQMREKEAAPDPAPVAIGDARPLTLYISRAVTNAAAIVAWAKGQGFDTTITALDMHVTVAYSRDPVDWFEVGEPWSSELKLPAGGPRLVEQFDGGAIVLLFACDEVRYRHNAVKRAGGSHDYAEFQPHITIAYSGERRDLTTIEPYTGPIELGPEIFRVVNPEWRPK